MEDYSLLLLLGIVSVAIFVLYLHKRTKTAHVQGYKLPPGSMGWPLIGETIYFFQSLKSHSPRHFVDPRQLRYGDIFSSHLMGRRVIISVNPEFNKFVLQNEGRLFQVSGIFKSFTELIGKYGLLTVHGDLQRKIHGVAVNLLKYEKLSSEFMDDIQNLLINAMSKWDGKKLKLQEECHQESVLLNVMAKQLLDLSPSKETEEIGRQFLHFSAAIVSLPVKIPGSKFTKGIKARKFLINKIYKIMEERRKHPQVFHNDLLTKFLTEEPVLSDEIVADTLLFLLFAGHETSSRTMAMSIKFLTECPQALKQLQDEHDSILKSNGNKKLSWDDYKSMKFTECVVNEVLRLGNVAPFLYRDAKQDVSIKGYHIPKGSTIIPFMCGVHMDEKNYVRALEFNPWRWEGCGNEVSNNPAFTPFGGGGRMCPGAHLARLEISVFLHHFVTKFRWDVLGNDRISYLPFPYLVNGLPIQLHLRG